MSSESVHIFLSCVGNIIEGKNKLSPAESTGVIMMTFSIQKVKSHLCGEIIMFYNTVLAFIQDANPGTVKRAKLS